METLIDEAPVAIGVLLPTGRAQWGAGGDPRDLVRRLDETVALWRALWNGAASFHGELLSFSDLPPATRPYRTGGPPVWLGGSTRSALARTGRHYDGWLPYPPDPADYTTGLHAIQDAATTADRDTGRITPALFVTVRIDRDGRGPLDAYAQATYGMPLTDLEKIQAVITGTTTQVTTALTHYIAAGARHLILRPAAPDLGGQHAQIEQIAAILPALRRTTDPETSAANPAEHPSRDAFPGATTREGDLRWRGIRPRACAP